MNHTAVKPDNNTSSNFRTGKELHTATLPFAIENPTESWFHSISTFLLLGLTLTLAATTPWLLTKILFSLISGLIMVRGFAIYHDYMHGAILRKSKLAKAMFYTYGALLLTPPTAWRVGHNHHHAHVGQITKLNPGTFPIITTDTWKNMSFFEKLKYRFVRNPIIMALSYITVFLYSLCIEPLQDNLRKHWDSVAVVAVHFTVAFLLYKFAGGSVTILSYLLPLWTACTIGAYLFYVQHNWEGMQYLPSEEWNCFDAAVHSSSYLKLSPLMCWFTANIGYHHVHHLNSRIPFYKLPKAMAAIPELQNPGVTTLSFRDILSSLKLKLWDIHSRQLVAFKQVS